jgi:hypothetical protein
MSKRKPLKMFICKCGLGFKEIEGLNRHVSWYRGVNTNHYYDREGGHVKRTYEARSTEEASAALVEDNSEYRPIEGRNVEAVWIK